MKTTYNVCSTVYRLYFIPFILTVLLVINTGRAQAQIKGPAIWAFGSSAGLDFRNGSPVPITTGINSAEATAVQCGSGGNLLFYTNGINIWNWNNSAMPNADNLQGNALTSSAQGVLSVPVPGDTNRYYVFSHRTAESVASTGGLGALFYSIVDMRLDSGRGDVVANRKNLVLDSMLSEQMTVIKNPDCSYWLVAHDRNTTTFKSYPITAAGIGAPVLSSSSSFVPNPLTFTFGNGEMLFSPKRNKLYYSTAKGAGYYMYIEMHDFDPATGQISNAQMLSDSNVLIYLSLSPNEDLLYASGVTFIGALMHGAIYQFDVSLPSPPAVASSKTQVFYDAVVNIADILLGPDDKIYFVTDYQGTSLGRIESPNTPGTGCSVVLGAVPLLPSTHAWTGLPNPAYIAWTNFESSITDTVNCFADSMLLHAPQGFSRHRWSNTDTAATIAIKNSGQYWVRSTAACSSKTDSFKVNIANVGFTLGNDTSVCEDIVLSVPLKDATYKWNTGSTEANTHVNKSGRYSVLIKKGDCTNTDTINIANKRLSINLGPDTTICNGTGMTFSLLANATSYLWSDGNTEAVYKVSQPGIYAVRGDNGTCFATDTIQVAYGECDCTVWIPNAFSPNGDGKNDYFAPVLNDRCPIKNYKLEVYNRWGQRIFSSNSEELKWNGFDKSHIAEIGTYMYQFEMTDIYDRRTYRKGDVTLVR